jgi:hypothetical protein
VTGAGGRRRAWRWAAGVWAVLVLTGGGLTLWLQDANEPPPPVQWYEAPTSPPSPDMWSDECPTPSPGLRTLVICAHESRQGERR